MNWDFEILETDCLACDGWNLEYFFRIFAFIFEDPSHYPVTGLLRGVVTPAFFRGVAVSSSISNETGEKHGPECCMDTLRGIIWW